MSERPLSVDEKCCCGAEFHYRTTTSYPKATAEAAAAWRANHRHIEPGAVGICGEANRIAGPNPSTAICDLPAGHAGWHQDGDRARWGYPRFHATPTDQPEEVRCGGEEETDV